jgi:hypothetical protein
MGLEISEEVSMFRVGAFALVVLVLSLFFGCSDKTSDVKPTGLELSFPNCLSFNAQVFVDNNFVGSFSSERAWFIDVATGSHTLYAHANIVVVKGDTSFCWTQNFNVADGQTTRVQLDCRTGGCPPTGTE